MRHLGELCLLGAFVSSGVAAFALLAAGRTSERGIQRLAVGAAIVCSVLLSVVMIVLTSALIKGDYQFAYVAAYTSNALPWHFRLSALWVGQAGSLLVWTWFSVILALIYWRSSGRSCGTLGQSAFGVLMGCVCFLIAIMVFAADPMQRELADLRDGNGLSPALQHPAMLIHPPIIFLGYALWSIPFALASGALITGRLDATWVRRSRAWALLGWTILGAGILLGAHWAYQELGWGGYWSWDPVENGSLVPWLAGTAFIHTLMTWQYRGAFKKTAISLAIITFGLCNFATFLTRSGLFSSLHAFSQSPIGWLFLLQMCLLLVAGVGLIWLRRSTLASELPIEHILSRESGVAVATWSLLLLTAVTIVGTLSTALSEWLLGRAVVPGPAFYNYALVITGVTLLSTTAAAPLLHWGNAPTATEQKCLVISVVIGVFAAGVAYVFTLPHPLELIVLSGAITMCSTTVLSVAIDAAGQSMGWSPVAVLRALAKARRQYAGFVIHLGIVCLFLGVAGSSLRTEQREFAFRDGEQVNWNDYDLRLIGVRQLQKPGRLIAEAELQLQRAERPVATLRPSQQFHTAQQQWTSEVAIHSTWEGDIYTILHRGLDQERTRITVVKNPMMRWMWCGGWIVAAGAVLRLMPSLRRRRSQLMANTTGSKFADNQKLAA